MTKALTRLNSTPISLAGCSWLFLLAEPDGEGAAGKGSAEAMALVPKSLVDFESCGAVWVNAEDLVDEGSDGRPPQPQRKRQHKQRILKQEDLTSLLMKKEILLKVIALMEKMHIL